MLGKYRSHSCQNLVRHPDAKEFSDNRCGELAHDYLRHMLGDMPVMRLNTVAKCCGDGKR